MDEATDTRTVGKQRIEALSDGIYAIALTLLVLELKVPSLPEHAGNGELVALLAHHVLPRAVTWLLSFWVMAILWLAQVRSYRRVHSLSWRLVRVQLLVLATISLLPFSTALLGEYSHLRAASVVYCANLLAIGLFSWFHTHLLLKEEPLHARPLQPAVRRRLHWRSAMLVACAGASLLLAFVATPLNMLAMLPLVLRPGEEPAGA